MLERFTKEKQRASVRGGRQEIFNLGDDEDEEGGGLTHYGKSLGFDDFEGEGMGGGLGFEDEEEGGEFDELSFWFEIEGEVGTLTFCTVNL